MTALARQEIFGLDPDTDLHRGPPDEIHARFHDDQITQMDGLAEIDPVDRDGDAVVARVTKGGDGRGPIHHRKDDAAEDMTEIVRVLRHHDLGGFVLSLADGPRLQGTAWRHRTM